MTPTHGAESTGISVSTGSSMFIADMLSLIKMSPQCRKETTNAVFYSGLEKMKFTDYMGFSDKP